MSMFDKIFKTSVKFLRKNSVLICTTGAVVGVGLTVFTTSKTTLAVNKVVHNEELQKKEKIAFVAKASVPTAASVIFTLACIVASYKLGKKKEAMLLGALMSTQQIFQTYRNKVATEKGRKEETELYSESVIESKKLDEKDVPTVSNGKIIWCESITGEFFEATETEILTAEYNLNRKFILTGEASLNDFYEFLDIPLIDEGYVYGWSQNYGWEFYGYQWIEFQHTKYIGKDGKEYRLITYPFLPHVDFDNVDGDYDILDALIDNDLWKKDAYDQFIRDSSYNPIGKG